MYLAQILMMTSAISFVGVDVTALEMVLVTALYHAIM
jgi:hypothetical protein